MLRQCFGTSVAYRAGCCCWSLTFKLTLIPDRQHRVLALLGLLLEGYLPLMADELGDWTDQPEDYYLLQDSIEARESVRVRKRQGETKGQGKG